MSRSRDYVLTRTRELQRPKEPWLPRPCARQTIADRGELELDLSELFAEALE